MKIQFYLYNKLFLIKLKNNISTVVGISANDFGKN